MNIFVTGGAGFIGGRVVEYLIQDGHAVTVFDNLTTGTREQVPPAAKLIIGDLRDPAALAAAVRGHDAVIHLAAKAIVPESVAKPQEYVDVNLIGGHNLLEAMRAEGIKRLIYSSSAGVYGQPVHVPAAEDDLKLPTHPYGATKLALEDLLHSYHAAYGFNVMIFRYFNPYGPTEAHDPETHAIPNFINAALKNEPVPLYWGGRQIRDFFFVDDVARAHVMGLAHNGFHIYNLGSGSGVLVKDVLGTIIKLTGSTSAISDLGERPGDPTRLLADTSRVQRELGWRPQVSLEDGLARTVVAFRVRQS